MKNLFKFVQVLFLLICIPTVASCSDDSFDEVKKFLHVLGKEKCATLSDYYHFYGSGAEQELIINFEICKDKGWTPPDKNISCMDYIKNRQVNHDKYVSLYLLWLRSKIPEYSNIELVEIRRNNTSFEHELIQVNLDKNTVLFFRTIEPQKRGAFGSISITEINGISINELFLNDLNNGYIVNIANRGCRGSVLNSE